MKTKIIILLVAIAVVVSLGASRISKGPKKTELASSATSAPIGGIGVEDR